MDGSDESAQFHSDEAGFAPVATYTNWQNHSGGTGNIDADPVFTGAGDYTLASGSPCIDAGQDTSIPVGVTEDLVQTPRELNDPATADTGDGTAPVVDMGSYEYFLSCTTAEDCGDIDGTTGIIDDRCQWYECVSDEFCNAVDREYADVGGPSLACPLDSFCNLFDLNLIQACFEQNTPCGALNMDVGSAFGACPPDGFCNLFDLNHVAGCFQQIPSPCTCPPSPAPEFGPVTVDQTGLALVPVISDTVGSNEKWFRVFTDSALDNLQSYQLQLGVSGSVADQVEWVDVFIEERSDFVFAGRSDRFDAVNVAEGKMLAGLIEGGVPAAGGYLATFVYRVNGVANGNMVISVLHNEAAGDHTFMVSDYVDRIEIQNSPNDLIAVEFTGAK